MTLYDSEIEDMYCEQIIHKQLISLSYRNNYLNILLFTTRSALMEFSHLTSVSKIEARGSTAVSEYCINPNTYKKMKLVLEESNIIKPKTKIVISQLTHLFQ